MHDTPLGEEESSPNERLRPATRVSRSDRDASLRALHVLEDALSAPAPRRQRTWLHRVTYAVDALATALEEQTSADKDTLDLLAEIALCQPALCRSDRAASPGTTRSPHRGDVAARADRTRPGVPDRHRRHQGPAVFRRAPVPPASRPRGRPRVRRGQHRPRSHRLNHGAVRRRRWSSVHCGDAGCDRKRRPSRR